ncbi:MAG: GntR family transcriptional regulator [Tissierellaceae bacterium]|jgi:GntR family transcriptional regulator|nr:GntR family transcriptional regulator [Tissierellaceae bacterium]
MGDFIPKYKLLSDKICEVFSNTQDGSALPSERELCNIFKVSRTTVRKALKILADEGKITKISGKGFVLAKNNLNITTKMYTVGFYNDLASQGKKVSSKVIYQTVIKADQNLSQKLQIQPEDTVFHLLRLRSVEGIKYSLSESYIPLERCEKIIDYDFTDKSLWDILRSLGFDPKVVNQLVYVRLINEFELHFLELQPNSPVLINECLAYDKLNPIEFSRVITNAFNTKLEFNFVPNLKDNKEKKGET